MKLYNLPIKVAAQIGQVRPCSRGFLLFLFFFSSGTDPPTYPSVDCTTPARSISGSVHRTVVISTVRLWGVSDGGAAQRSGSACERTGPGAFLQKRNSEEPSRRGSCGSTRDTEDGPGHGGDEGPLASPVIKGRHSCHVSFWLVNSFAGVMVFCLTLRLRFLPPLG